MRNQGVETLASGLEQSYRGPLFLSCIQPVLGQPSVGNLAKHNSLLPAEMKLTASSTLMIRLSCKYPILSTQGLTLFLGREIKPPPKLNIIADLTSSLSLPY